MSDVWKPIATAPQDSTIPIRVRGIDWGVLGGKKHYGNAIWSTAEDAWVSVDDPDLTFRYLTHWKQP